MELIRGLHNLRDRHRGCVATIGNYDGVHLGHRTVLSGLREQSERLDQPTLVMTFEPTPREFFAPGTAPFRLTRFRDKVLALAAEGVDRLLVARFDHRMANMAPETFIESVLVGRLAVQYLVVGDDFRFGRDRKGDFAMLERAGRRFGFEVRNTPTLERDGERVSSTRIRTSLEAGELDRAEALLGRRYSVSGRVGYGERIGTELGFPTINLSLGWREVPLHGVFVTRVTLDDGARVWGVANVGHRPTVNGKHRLLEVHLLDFDGDLYGRHVSVAFHERIRGEERFDSLEELRTWIGRDVEAARDRIRKYG